MNGSIIGPMLVPLSYNPSLCTVVKQAEGMEVIVRIPPDSECSLKTARRDSANKRDTEHEEGDLMIARCLPLTH